MTNMQACLPFLCVSTGKGEVVAAGPGLAKTEGDAYDDL